jgi:hypothetical protein
MMRAIIEKSKFPLNLGKRTPKQSKRRYVYLEIMIHHLKRGLSGA